MTSRRKFLGFAVFTLAAPIVAACGGAPAPTPQPGKPAAAGAQPAGAPLPTSTSAAGAVQATSTAAAAAAQAPAKAGQTTVEFLHTWEGDHGGARAMVALAKRYEELKPNVKINQTIV